MVPNPARNEYEYRGHLLERLDSIASSLEKMASDPEVEIEAGPAFCPHCGTLNPSVEISPTEGEGNLLDYVLVAHCKNCQETFFGIVESWSMFTSVAALEADVEERAASSNGN